MDNRKTKAVNNAAIQEAVKKALQEHREKEATAAADLSKRKQSITPTTPSAAVGSKSTTKTNNKGGKKRNVATTTTTTTTIDANVRVYDIAPPDDADNGDEPTHYTGIPNSSTTEDLSSKIAQDRSHDKTDDTQQGEASSTGTITHYTGSFVFSFALAILLLFYQKGIPSSTTEDFSNVKKYDIVPPEADDDS